MSAIGFIGLGNMGSVLARNLVETGHRVIAHDVAGPQRTPDGAEFVASPANVATAADIVVLSLPNGSVSAAVIDELLQSGDRRLTHLVDTSTTGVESARRNAEILDAAGIGFVDAPVSGGVAGARARTLLAMYAGSPESCRAVEPVLDGMTDRRRHVGDQPGLAQAVKRANNFLTATILAAASEAVTFGTSVGLDMATLLEVINASSGRSAVTSEKFPDHVVTGRYASGFASALMAKDVQLYMASAAAQGTPTTIGQVTADLWASFADSMPDADFTRIYEYVADA